MGRSTLLIVRMITSADSAVKALGGMPRLCSASTSLKLQRKETTMPKIFKGKMLTAHVRKGKGAHKPPVHPVKEKRVQRKVVNHKQ
jgi:hypothetical protein